MESAAYWSPLGFFTSWRYLNLIVCQTGSSSHLNKHAKGEVEFVSPQLENVSLESLLVLSCESFLGLMWSGLTKLFQILYRYSLPWARCFSSSAFLPTTQCFQAFTCYPKSENVNILPSIRNLSVSPRRWTSSDDWRQDAPWAAAELPERKRN